DLFKRLARGVDQLGTAPGLDHAGAEHDGLDFVARKHQRRNVEAAAQHITDASFTVDWHARGLQVGDVAIDGALGNFEFLRQHARSDEAAATQKLDDLEQSVGTPHVVSVVPRVTTS